MEPPGGTTDAPLSEVIGEVIPETALAPDHARLVEVALPLFGRHGLALAGADAAQAHGITAGPTRDLDLVTGVSTPVEQIASELAVAFRSAGCAADPHPEDARTAKLLVTAVQGQGAPCAVGISKEPLSRPPVPMDLGLAEPVPVASLEDTACLAVRALAEGAGPGDLAKVHGMSAYFSQGELLAMTGTFDEDFRPGALADRLEKLADLDDEAYVRRGLTPQQAQKVKRWALAWVQDIRLDLMEAREDPDSFYLAEQEADPDSGPVSDDP
jgi:hypothetical protein